MADADKARKPPNATDAPGATGSDATPGNGASADATPPPFGKDWRAPRGQLGHIHEALETTIGAVSLWFWTAGDFHCYTVLAERGPLLAQAWTDLAGKNPAVKAYLLKLTQGGHWGQVIFATASVALPIMEHHGIWRFPNPWSILQTTPADHDPAAATAAAAEAAGMDPVEFAAAQAEADRRAVEQRRAAQAAKDGG